MPVQCTCRICGSVFYRPPCRAAGGARFCSRPCRYLGQRQPLTERIARYSQRNGDCIDWIGSSNGGHDYGIITFTVKRQKIAKYIHRVVWEMHHGPIPEGMFVCHTCDRPKCIEIAHLFLGQPGDNTRDMWAKGRGKAPGVTH